MIEQPSYVKRILQMNKHSNKWIMKFRPEHVKDVIIPDCYRKFFNDIVEKKEIPNLMMYGKAGTGKSTMAEAIIRDTDAVVFEINTSLDGRVELLKEDLQKFARTRAPNGRPKIVYLDEFDGGSAAFQAGLRKLIEESAVNCSYLMTCNYPTKIIGPLHEGRTMEIDFNFSEKEMQDSLREQINSSIRRATAFVRSTLRSRSTTRSTERSTLSCSRSAKSTHSSSISSSR